MGVKKYGPGNWSIILKDKEFNEKLQKRSNVNMKDKWREMKKTKI